MKVEGKKEDAREGEKSNLSILPLVQREKVLERTVLRGDESEK